MLAQDIRNILSQLTLDEKIDMIHGATLFQTKGIPALGIPPLHTDDGPMGVRAEYEPENWFLKGFNDDFTSYLPCNSALAATFNKERAYESGQVLGLETRGRGKDMILAPGINIHRSPLCGRSFEYMSEDPCLTGGLAVPFIQGIQESDVSACVKHFALNNQETRRMDVDVNVSERALWEIYLPAFRASVKQGNALGIMGAYNRFHGIFCCHHNYLIDEILRKDWGFKGIFISDWGGVHDTMEAANTGIDIEMSVTNNFDDYYMANPLKKAVLSGEIPESLLDDKILHILHVMNELHMLDGERKPGGYNLPVSREKLLLTAEESIILLKNENHALPLVDKSIRRLLVIGDNANRLHANGGGSAEIKALYEISPLMGLKMLLGGNTEVSYEPGYYTRVIGNVWGNDAGESWQATSLDQNIELAIKKNLILPEEEIDRLNAEYLNRAKTACKNADAVIYIGGTNHDYDVEGRDRDNLELPYGQNKIIKELLSIRPDMIVTILAGAPVDMSSWEAQASAILFSYYNGMEGGLALAKVLFGRISPSGKLPDSFPKSLNDCPAHKIGEFPGTDSVSYTEDIFVGYRFHDFFGVKPAFAFGHGLSYASFLYQDIKLSPVVSDKAFLCDIELTVTNTSTFCAKEAVQIYVAPEDTDFLASDGSFLKRPLKELRAFDKKSIPAGSKVTYHFLLDTYDFSYYDEALKCYIAPKGNYQILAGTSSDDIRLEASVTLECDYQGNR